MLNGAAVGPSRIIVQPAGSLHKLFIGNVPRDVDARQLLAGISAIEPVSAARQASCRRARHPRRDA
jgi:hypothetical protein